MALAKGIGRAAWVAALSAGVAACAPTLQRQYGEPALQVRHFPALDSAVAHHRHARVTVWIQLDLAPPPGRLPPPELMIRGRLASSHDGWLHLLRGNGDTIRVGKDYVERVRLVRPGGEHQLIGGLVGGVALGLLGWFVARGGPERPASESVALIGGGALLGAGLGILIMPGARPGAQLYPPAFTRTRRTP